MRQAVRHWWNGKMGRLARRDVKIYREDQPWVVEAREGGADGKSRWWQLPDEEAALQLARDLMTGDPNWKDMTDLIGRVSPVRQKD